MKDKTSERIRLAHLESDLRQKSFELQATIDFREYIARLLSGQKPESADEEFDIYVQKFIKTLGYEKTKLEKQKLASEDEMKNARREFDDINKDYYGGKSQLSKEIDKLSSEANQLINDSQDIEQQYYYQKGVCSEIEKFIKRLSVSREKSDNLNVSRAMANVTECLAGQVQAENAKKQDLEQQYYDAEMSALRKIDDLIYQIRQEDYAKEKGE